MLLDCDIEEEKSGDLRSCRADQEGFLRQSNCYVRTAVFIKLLCEWMRILSISCKE